MKMNIRKYAKAFLAGVLSLALVLQAFNGLSFVSEATTETDVHADTVIYPTAETVTAGNASTNGVTDANITFTGFSGYPTADNAFAGYLEILTAKYSDITSGAITAAMTKNSAVVLQFTNPINVANHNRMTINIAMCGWSDPTAPSTTYIYASGASDLATDNAIDTFTTDNNYNVTLDVSLDLTKYADADGYVRNLTFLCDSTVNYNYLFGAFRLSYEDVHAATVIYPTAETVTAGNASTNGVTDANITFTGFSGYPTADNAFAGYLGILTAKYSDITSGAITAAMTKNSAVVLQFTNPINVANHNRMTINIAMCGWSDPTAPSTTYIYASGASDLATDNAIDTFTTDNNYNVTLDVNLDLTKYADADGYVRNLTFLCDSTVNYNYLFGAFRLSYEDVHADTVIYPTAETVTAGNASTNGVTDANITFTGFSGYPTADNAFAGYLGILTAKYSDITSGAITAAMTKNSAVVLQFTNPINVANHNKMTINIAMCGWSNPTAPSTTYIYASGASDLATENAIDTFTTDNNYNVTLDVSLDLTKYADADGYVRNLTFLCDSTVNYNYLFGAFRLSYDASLGTPEEPGTPAEPTYTELAFGDWSTSVGVVEGSNIYSLAGHDDITSLDGVAISGKVNFNNSAWLRIGGTESVKHGGVWFGSNANGLYMIPQGIGEDGSYAFPVPAAEWEALKSTEITLRVTFDKAEDGSAWTVGVFVNGADKGSYIFNGITPGLYIGIDSAITVDMTTSEPDTPDEPDEPDDSKTYTDLTFSNWGILDGEYISGYAYDLTNGLTSLNGTAFNGVLNFNGTPRWLRIGAPNGWEGLLLTVRENTLIIDSEVSGFNTLDNILSYTEKNLLTEEFKLRLTFDYDSDNNVKLGVWIDDEFQRYLTYEGMAAAMGTNLLIDEAGVTIADVGTKDEETDTTPTEKAELPKNLTEVTFESFGIEDGTYKYNGNLLAAEGQYARPLGSSIFSGDFYIPSGSNVDFRYGGVSLNWFGLIFANTADGKLYLEGIADDVKVTNSYVFNPAKAGTEFIDTWFNLKLTTEIVDSDSDGAKDDVKLGVWFNDVLYNNKYIELQDYAQYLGNRVGVYVRDEDSSVKLKTDTTVYMGVDFTLFGFTRNWEKELGLK